MHDEEEPTFHDHGDASAESKSDAGSAGSASAREPSSQLSSAASLSASSENGASAAAAAPSGISVRSGKTYQVVVMDGNPSHDWVKLFSNCELADGSAFRIVQCSWIETAVTVYHRNGGCIMTVAPVRESEGKVSRPATMTVKPDFMIVRNQPRGPTPASDRRHVLYGLAMAGVPAINSLQSMLLALERPIMFGELRKIEERVGHDRFPLIAQNYYSDYKQMTIAPPLPCVVKVSHAHAGMGKIKLETNDGFRDLATVLALNGDYATAEKFYPCEYGIRVQKIGHSYRVLKKIFTGAGWKSQFGGADLQEIPLTHKYKLWADEAAKCFGGLDLLAVDALCYRKKPLPTGVKGTTDNADDFDDVIIELNDTAIGILGSQWMEESKVIRDLAISRMDELFVKRQAQQQHSFGTETKGETRVAEGAKDWNGEVAEDQHKRLLRRELDESKAAALHAQAALRAKEAALAKARRVAFVLALLVIGLAVAVAVVAATR